MSINLITADKKDVNYFFTLRKYDSNKFSFIKNQNLEFENHKNWFLKSLKNKKNLMYIIKLNNRSKCGYIRLDIKSKDYYVSICIAKKFRRKGIGSKALSLIEKKINNSKIITALVNKKNLNSIEMFSKHGYTVHSKKKNYLIMTKKLNKVKIIDQIEMIRRKNNGNWMDLLRLAYKNSPRESTMIMAKIYKDDNRISKLVKKLIK
tara:strand:- start:619 stop:1236 length:618 start_codon:yes stop_codon:yes gene_type:complete